MNKPFDRVNIGLRERPSSADLNQMQSQIYQTLCELTRTIFSGRTSNSSSALASASGFLHDSMRVRPVSPAAMSVQVNSGFGFVYDTTDIPSNIGATDLEQVNDLATFKPLSLISPITFAVPAAPGSPNSRIDIIEVKADRRLENAITRRQLDAGSLSWLDHVFFKALAFNLDGRSGVGTNPTPSTAGLSYKIGTPANPGLVPATTAGYVKVAEINVPTGTTSITGTNIVDRRRLLGVGGLIRASARIRVQFPGAPPSPASIISIDAPPGVDVGVASFVGAGHKGNFLMYLTAGDFTRIVRHVSIEAATPSLVNVGQSITWSGTEDNQPIVVVDSVFQPEMATTGIAVGIGQVAARLVSDGQTCYRDATGAGFGNSSQLNNVVYNVMFEIAYH